MTTPPLPGAPQASPRRILGPGMILVAIALLILLGFGYCATRLVPGAIFGRNATNITHDVVVQQIRAVAKLVSSEATVRDVIVYENTWYGSTKRSLVVVTGRLLAGIDLRDNPDVSIDHAKRLIRIRIPPAKLIAVEIRDMQTYDERGGLWNPFTREDRDAIQRQARLQLTAAGGQLELIRHANESAVELLRMLLAKDGYAVDVALRGT
ncbi:MAG: DUF4230 domain-containing protein [Gemmatimonadaceae bacterium]